MPRKIIQSFLMFLLINGGFTLDCYYTVRPGTELRTRECVSACYSATITARGNTTRITKNSSGCINTASNCEKIYCDAFKKHVEDGITIENCKVRCCTTHLCNVGMNVSGNVACLWINIVIVFIFYAF